MFEMKFTTCMAYCKMIWISIKFYGSKHNFINIWGPESHSVSKHTVKTVLIRLLPLQWHSKPKRCASAPVMPARSGRKLGTHCFFPTLVRTSETEQLDLCEKKMSLSFSFSVMSSVLLFIILKIHNAGPNLTSCTAKHETDNLITSDML